MSDTGQKDLHTYDDSRAMFEDEQPRVRRGEPLDPDTIAQRAVSATLSTRWGALKLRGESKSVMEVVAVLTFICALGTLAGVAFDIWAADRNSAGSLKLMYEQNALTIAKLQENTNSIRELTQAVLLNTCVFSRPTPVEQAKEFDNTNSTCHQVTRGRTIP